MLDDYRYQTKQVHRNLNHGLRFFILPCLVVAFVLGPGVAAADDIPTVNITEAGPDRDVPLGPFYLAGTAVAGTQRIQAFVVRTSMPWLLGGDGPSCSDVLTQLGKFKGIDERGNAKAIANLPKIQAGTNATSRIWMTSKDWETIATVAWEPKDTTKDETFKLFVNGDDFFVAGASYCLYIYKEKVDSESVQKILQTLSDQLDICSQEKTPEEVNHCTSVQLSAFDTGFTTLGTDAATIAKVRENATKALSDLRNLQRSSQRAHKLLAIWGSSSPVAKPLVARNEKLPAVMDLVLSRSPKSPPNRDELEGNTLGLAIAELLVEHGKLDRISGKLYTRDGKVVVTRLQLLGDFSDILVSDSVGAPGKHLPLGVKADDLNIPTTDLTLRDLLELSRNQIRVGKGYESVTALAQQLNPILVQRGVLSDTDRATLTGAAQRLASLAAYVQHALGARTPMPAAPQPPVAASKVAGGGIGENRNNATPHSPPSPAVVPSPGIPGIPAAPKPPPNPNPPALDTLLGNWLFGRAIVCSEAGYDTWAGNDAIVKPNCNPAGTVWPGYSNGDNPLAFLGDDLNDFLNSLDKWQKEKGSLSVANLSKDTALVTQPLSKNFQFTQSTWLFSYATPVVGYGVVMNASEKFNVGYYGVQIHFVPNAVNDPLWSHGTRDIARLVAIEVGASLPATTYGPGGRFSGWQGLPPLFVGGTLHLLPYVGISAGGVLFERRSSPLTQEKAEAFFGPYIGMNVQINVPDLIRGMKTTTSTKTQ